MPLRVLHVVRPVRGGIKKHLEILFRGIDQEKYHLYLAAPPEIDLFTELRPYARGVFPVLISETWHPLRNWRTINTLSRVIRSNNIDLVHTHGVRAGLIGQVAALLAGCKRVVATVHNCLNPDTPFFLIYRLVLAILGKASITHMITVSNALKQEMMTFEWFPDDRITVIYNGLNASEYQVEVDKISLRNSLGIPGDLPVIGSVARLEPNKGIKFLLEAVKDIDKIYGPVYVLIVGDGPEEESLKKITRELGIESRVIFAGFRSDVPQLLSLFDVAVIPSVNEGLSIFCLEALAAGVPVVASAVGGLPELIQPDVTGLLVPPGDLSALVEAIVFLLRNKDFARSLGHRGREMVVRQFTSEQMLARTIDVYEMVIQGGKQMVGSPERCLN